MGIVVKFILDNIEWFKSQQHSNFLSFLHRFIWPFLFTISTEFYVTRDNLLLQCCDWNDSSFSWCIVMTFCSAWTWREMIDPIRYVLKFVGWILMISRNITQIISKSLIKIVFLSCDNHRNQLTFVDNWNIITSTVFYSLFVCFF